MALGGSLDEFTDAQILKAFFYFRPLIVAYYDVNFDHQFLKDTQFIRNKIVEVAKKFSTSNLKFAISNEVEFEDEIK